MFNDDKILRRKNAKYIMNKVEKFIEKLLDLVPGGFYALLSMCIGLSFIFTAMANFPGYNMIDYYVSNLGVGPGLSAPVFNIGLFLAGLIAIPFFIYLGNVLEEEGEDDPKRKWAVRISVIGCLALSTVGCFPASKGFSYIMHIIFAGIFFICGLLFCILFSIVMLKDSRYSKSQSILGFMVGISFAFFLMTGVPLTEWIVFFCIVFWVIENGIYTLYKKF